MFKVTWFISTFELFVLWEEFASLVPLWLIVTTCSLGNLCVLLLCSKRVIPERGRMQKLHWLSIKELPRYAKILSTIFGKRAFVSNPRSPLERKGYKWDLLYLIVPKISLMWTKSGVTFAIKYWSEVLRLTVQYLDPRANALYDKVTWVKRHVGKPGLNNFSGLPKILPYKVKVLLRDIKRGLFAGSLPRGQQIQLKLILSMLSWFRAASPEYSKTSYATITKPFSGISEVLDNWELKKALNTLGILTLKVKKPSVFWASSKAGPNFPIATFGSGLDALGWVMRPKKWLQYLLMCWTRRYWQCLTFFVLTSCLLLPLLPLLWATGMVPHLGHLAVLEEARGKRRVIGITDFWTQVLFRPLHDAIYHELNKLPYDGTRNQLGPMELLLKQLGVRVLDGKKTVQSLDLSAATDRLPVKLQARILSLLGFQGELWMSILEREWHSRDGFHSYAVGQPMGAYSSFAMLALTNHVLVNVAKNRASLSNVPYGVLGDDVAIANKRVSALYRGLLSYLGVEVNPIKGFDGTILEFAKQLWTLNGYNISPLGAKNIVLAIRFPAFISSLLFELWAKRFPLMYRIPPRNAIYQRSKRRVRGQERPFLTADSLLFAFKGLFYREYKDGEFGWVKQLLRLSSYIGPRSGLWYVSSDVRGYLRGWDYGLYQALWFDLVNRVMKNKSGVSNKKLLLHRIKFELGEDRISILKIIRTSWQDALNLMTLALGFPWTATAYVRSWFSWENKRLLVAQSTVFIFAWSVLFSPSILIVLLDVVKRLNKVIFQVWSVIYIRLLRVLSYYHKHGFLRESFVVTLFLLPLTWDLLFVSYWVIPLLILHFVVYERWYLHMILQRLIYWHKWYGLQGENIVLDTSSKVFNPFDGVQTIIGRLDREFKVDEIPAWKETLSLLKYERVVNLWIKEHNSLKRNSFKKKEGSSSKDRDSLRGVKLSKGDQGGKRASPGPQKRYVKRPLGTKEITPS